MFDMLDSDVNEHIMNFGNYYVHSIVVVVHRSMMSSPQGSRDTLSRELWIEQTRRGRSLA